MWAPTAAATISSDAVDTAGHQVTAAVIRDVTRTTGYQVTLYTQILSPYTKVYGARREV